MEGPPEPVVPLLSGLLLFAALAVSPACSSSPKYTRGSDDRVNK
jgi:hypothetical protein